jgi:hypothetical protein
MDVLFRCDYCSEYHPLHKAQLFFEDGDVTTDPRPVDESGAPEPGMPVQLVHPAVYCSPFCGRNATVAHGSARG